MALTKENKRKMILFLFLVSGLLLPFTTGAQEGGPFGAVFSNLGNNIVALIISFIVAISSYLVAAADYILDWVISDNFIHWDYTGIGADANPIVEVGWRLVRDLCNMFFVIGLAFIGLASALGLEKYKWQRNLFRFILMALLANFSRVIAGVLIDASNIVMNFFFGNFSGIQQATAFAHTEVAQIRATFGSGFTVMNSLAAVLQGLVMVFFNIAYANALLLFAFLFAARYIALWLFVILSPLAFLSNALPPIPFVKGFWKEWWSKLFQWCFVGVTGAFFLYLGNHVLLEAITMVGTAPPDTGPLGATWLDLAQSLVPYGVSLGFVYMGFLMAIKSSAEGVKYATGGFKWARGKIVGAGAAGAGAAGAAIGAAGERGKQLIREKTPERVRERLKSWATATLPSDLRTTAEEREAGAKGWISRVSKWAGRTAARPVIAGVRKVGEMAIPEQELKDIEEQMKEYKDFETPERFKEEMNKQTVSSTRVERIALLRQAEKKGVLGKMLKMGDEADQAGAKDEVLRTALEAFEVDPSFAKKLVSQIPESISGDSASARKLRSHLLKGKEEELEKLEEAGADMAEERIKMAFDEVVDSLDTSDIEDLGKEILTDHNFQQSFILKAPKHWIEKIYEEKGPEITEEFSEAFGRIESPFAFIEKNRRLARDLSHNPELRSMIGEENIPNLLRNKSGYRFLSEAANNPQGKMNELRQHIQELEGKSERTQEEQNDLEEVRQALKVIEDYYGTRAEEEEEREEEIEEETEIDSVTKRLSEIDKKRQEERLSREEEEERRRLERRRRILERKERPKEI